MARPMRELVEQRRVVVFGGVTRTRCDEQFAIRHFYKILDRMIAGTLAAPFDLCTGGADERLCLDHDFTNRHGLGFCRSPPIDLVAVEHPRYYHGFFKDDREA